MIGVQFGRWTIIGEAPPLVVGNGQRLTKFMCRCSCGKERAVLLRSMQIGASASCGCSRHRAIQDFIKRFEAKIMPEPNSGCWLWLGSIDPKGYGQIRDEWGHLRIASHISLQFLGIGVPPDMEVLHKCDNPPCVNPDHLRVGTHKDNMQDSFDKGRADHSGLLLGRGWQRTAQQQLDVLRARFDTGDTQSEAARHAGMAKGVALYWFKRWGHVARPMRDRTHCAHGHPYSGDNLRIKKNGERECRRCARTASRATKERQRAAAFA